MTTTMSHPTAEKTAAPLQVPLMDLAVQHRNLREPMEAAMRKVMERGAFIGGPELEAFETAFGAFHGGTCVGVGNGTDALRLALEALGIGKGDEIIAPAMTFIATIEAILHVGATPVIVDIDPETYNIDTKAVAAAITPRTRGIMPVHLYGQPADMTALGALAKKHNLIVIEDSAQAHGARWNGQRTGTLGTAACFSFYPAKNLGAYGDGGAIVSRDAELIRKAREFANHGRQQGKKYEHDGVGINSRLDNLQAAVLGVKLVHLEAWNQARRGIAKRYDKGLADIVGTPRVRAEAESVYHMYVITHAKRDALSAALKKDGVSTGMHYPVPVHLQPGLQALLGTRTGQFPVSERLGRDCLSLPMFPEMTDEQVERVIAAVRRQAPALA